MRFEVSDSLLDDEVRIRTEVFVEEQGFTDEFDDGVNDAIHIVLYDGDAPVATCCYTLASTDAPAEIKRVAVVRGRRGGSLGTLAVREAERQFSAVGGGEMLVVAQVRAKGFYERLGYAASGDEFPIEGCPHIRMWKAVPAHRFEIFDAPSDDEVRIRTEVFIDEQGFEAEFDDDDAVSKHIVLYEGGVPVAVCRIIPDGDSCHIGRVAVVRDHRWMVLGSVMVR